MRLVSFLPRLPFPSPVRVSASGDSLGAVRPRRAAVTALVCLLAIGGGMPAVAAPPVDRPAAGIEQPVEAEALRRALAEAETAEVAAPLRRRLETLRLHSNSAAADLLTARAGAARAAGDVGTALDLLDAAIAVAPHWAAGRRLRGLVHVERGAFGPAAVDLDAAARLDPSDATALFVSAALRERAGDPAAALDLARRAQAADPQLPGVSETVERLTLQVEGRPL